MESFQSRGRVSQPIGRGTHQLINKHSGHLYIVACTSRVSQPGAFRCRLESKSTSTKRSVGPRTKLPITTVILWLLPPELLPAARIADLLLQATGCPAWPAAGSSRRPAHNPLPPPIYRHPRTLLYREATPTLAPIPNPQTRLVSVRKEEELVGHRVGPS